MTMDPVLPVGAAPLDPDVFRAVAGRWATGVTVVSTVVDDLDHAMTANAFTTVSLDPLLVLVCVERDARFHEAVVQSGTWAVSVLEASARAASDWLATRGRPLHGQLDRVPFRRGAHTGAALLDHAIATMECRTTGVHEAGDHDIVVGEVLSLATPMPDGDPLVYYRGRYRYLR